MRKYRAQPAPQRTGGLLCLACLVLIALSTCPFALAPTALASSSHAIASSPPSQDITRSGVSVVRLVAQYVKSNKIASQSTTLTRAGTNNGPSSTQLEATVAATPSDTITCIGLGVLVANWLPSSATDKNVWILTDDALFNIQGYAFCAGALPNPTLSSLTVFFSSAYSGTTPQSLAVSPATISVQRDCHLQTDPQSACPSGATLFSFSNNAFGGKVYPYLDTFASDLAQNTAIALSRDANSLVKPDMTNPQSYLVPISTPFTTQTTSGLEFGTPVVNAAGELTGMHLKAGDVSAPLLKNFLTTHGAQAPATSSNIVHQKWVDGLTAFYKQPPDYKSAQSAFQAAFQANSEFQGAQTLAQMAQGLVPTPHASGGGLSLPSLTTNIPLLILIGVGIILFILLLVMWRRVLGPERARSKQFKEDLAEAERRSRVDAQRITAMQAQPQAQPIQPLQPTLVLPPVEPQPKLVLPPADPNFAPRKRFCPRCGTQLPGNATRCPICQLLLPAAAVPSSDVAPSPVVERAQPEASVVMHTPEPVREVSLPPPQAPPATPPVVEESLVLRQEAVMHLPEEELQITERVGTRLGNYKLLGLLGSGGFAEVYLGEHRYLKTKAAIKVLHKRLDIESLIGFLKEARTIANLVHPQIIRVLEFGVEGSDIDLEELEQSMSSLKRGAPFLIMDYAPGGTLRRRHPKGSRVPLPNVVTYVSHVAEALDYAHQNKIIHRDIKPENMLLRQRDEVLLSDFGIAVAAHGEQSLNTQDMAGTYPYMAPEQIRGKPRPASDQYSLAIVVYEWLCGTRPFQGSHWEIIEQHLGTTPASLCAKAPSLPKAVEQVVMRALSKEPSQRYESVKAFARALEDASR